MSRPPLNADQQAAVAAISSFIISDEKEFFLTGSPGVGKTFTTRELADVLPTILRQYHKAMGGDHVDYKQVCLTSTTNKAARVLSEHTGMEADTIHSFLGVKPQKDFKTGRTRLIKTNQWTVHHDKIIFIDEASMIEAALAKLIREATSDSCKILYIGDKNQLPPVMEKLSPAVRLAENPDLHYELTTPVRNANSPALMDLCNRLRMDIENETEKQDLTYWEQAPGQIEFINGEELKLLIEKMYGPNGIIQPNDENLACRILCYTNTSVLGYNQHIRQLRGLPDQPTPGEKLICNSHFPLSSRASFNVEEQVTVHDIEGPFEDSIDEYNSLEYYRLEVSSLMTGKHFAKAPASMAEYRHLMRHYARKKDWPKYYGLQENYIDLRNREACTVYKAQGSTYNSVIMVMSDIFSSRDINQLRRMLYVGASRARNKIYVYDKGIHTNDRGIYR